MIFLDLYNLALTAIPIVWFAVFDWEHKKSIFLIKPSLYQIGMEDVFFNTSAFWRWFFYAVWQGILLAYLVVYTFDTAEIEYG